MENSPFDFVTVKLNPIDAKGKVQKEKVRELSSEANIVRGPEGTEIQGY